MLGLIIAGASVTLINTTLPNAQSIKSIELKIPLRVYSADKLLISEFGNERRKPTTIDETPEILINAILASEDDRFYSHHGIDFFGIVRAALANFSSGSTQGASTITQQVARNFFLSPEQTYTRKIREILLALRLEQILSKDEILSLYINKIFLGHRAYGFGAAADVYYGKSLSELTLAETAVLAGLPKAPSTSNPLRNPVRALQRRDYVLKRLLELEKISPADYELSVSQASSAKQHSRGVELSAPHIAEMVRASLIAEMGEGAYWQGLNVYTTIQSRQQKTAQQALRNGLKSYDRRHGFRGPIKKINLSSFKNQESADQDKTLVNYSDILSDIPNSQEQIPALVISSTKESSSLYTNAHGMVNVSLDNSKWAKPYKTPNLRGGTPTAMNELLAPGDVVYIEPTASSAASREATAETDEQTAVPIWRLSQIPNVSGALISMDPMDGKIISLVGGYDFFLSKFNRAVQSIRQPGSNIKPFIYSASLDRGYTPASLISGAPIVINNEQNGTVWRPENYSGEFFGPTRMRSALAKSLNLVSIRLLRSIGIPYAREYIERFGINVNRFSPTLTMALGAGGTTPLEVLNAYSTLANTGYKIEPYFIDYITDKSGAIVYQAKQAQLCDECYLNYLEKYIPKEITENEESAPDTDTPIESDETEKLATDYDETLVESRTYDAPRVMSRSNNFLTVSMLKDVIKLGTGRKALALNRDDLAGKTGTTNDYVDAWFSGFNSSVATTVWVGFDEPSTLGRGEAGGVAALPIWVDYMKEALQGVTQDTQELPEYIEERLINKETGLPTDELDQNAITEYFVLEGLAPDILRQDINSEFENELIEGVPGLENTEEMEPRQTPQIRIIDSSEDTDGLF